MANTRSGPAPFAEKPSPADARVRPCAGNRRRAGPPGDAKHARRLRFFEFEIFAVFHARRGRRLG
jgi:hypothetical protein